MIIISLPSLGDEPTLGVLLMNLGIAILVALFAVVWFGSPHEPYSGLEEDLALYDDLPEEYAGQLFRLTSMETGQPTRRPLNEVLQERYAEITAMDRSIGQLFRVLCCFGAGVCSAVFFFVPGFFLHFVFFSKAIYCLFFFL